MIPRRTPFPSIDEQIEDLDHRSSRGSNSRSATTSSIPHHGAGKVLKKETREIFGESREYLTIKILHNDMTVMVPTENAAKAGLRRVIDEETVKKVLAVLADDVSEMPKNWNRRFKHNRDKIKTGDIYELAEVVRNLALRETEKGLSTGEKQMFTRAKKILASELMYALEMDEDERRDPSGRPAREVGRGQRQGRRSRPSKSSIAVLVAAGRGERLGADRPKAFVMLGGKPMLEWSVNALRVGRGPTWSSRCRPARIRPLGRSAPRAASTARSRCATRWRPRPRATRSSSMTPRGRSSPPTCARGDRGAGRPRRRDRGDAGGGHDQGGRRRRRRGAHAAAGALWAVQTPQVFRRAALERALRCPTTCWRRPPTTPGSSSGWAGAYDRAVPARATSR